MEFSFDTVRDWFTQHGTAVFAFFAFIDTFAPTGLFIPASLAIVAAGFLCAEGIVPALPALVLMYAAALAGNELTYLLGRISSGPLIRLVGRHIPRVQRMLKSEGPSLLLYYNFTNTLRAVLPVMCGVLRYPHARYFAFNTPGIVLWVSVYFLTGYLSYYAVAADSTLWQRIPSIISVAALVIAIWRIAVGLRRAGNPVEATGLTE